jgi:hypothetical protein
LESQSAKEKVGGIFSHSGLAPGRGRAQNWVKTTLMSTPVLDPNLPADHSPLSSAEMRGQFQAISNMFDDIRGRFLSLTPLGLTVSNPPTQAEVQAIADKLDELINSLSA